MIWAKTGKWRSIWTATRKLCLISCSNGHRQKTSLIWNTLQLVPKDNWVQFVWRDGVTEPSSKLPSRDLEYRMLFLEKKKKILPSFLFSSFFLNVDVDLSFGFSVYIWSDCPYGISSSRRKKYFQMLFLCNQMLDLAETGGLLPPDTAAPWNDRLRLPLWRTEPAAGGPVHTALSLRFPSRTLPALESWCLSWWLDRPHVFLYLYACGGGWWEPRDLTVGEVTDFT